MKNNTLRFGSLGVVILWLFASRFSLEAEVTDDTRVEMKNDGISENTKKFRELHGVSLPESVISCSSLFEKGEFGLSMVVLEAQAFEEFKKSLKVDDRRLPAVKGKTPNELGWGPWPVGSKTFIPGGMIPKDTKLFSGEAKPIEMLSCGSSIGLFLHVDVWEIKDGRVLLRVYTFQG